MTLRLQIDCYCQYKCNCKPIPGTKVTKQQIAYNLVRCNPALSKYFSSQYVSSQQTQNKVALKQRTSPYKSIVEQKNMRILLSDKYPAPSTPKKQENIQIRINNFMENYAQTSPKNSPQKGKVKKNIGPAQQQIKDYFKQLKQTSRYLSDTAFRKYFNRQVFQNYGRQNTHGINDGIVYGNYLKTHNINPHTGQNRPQDQETFYHALISASPQKMLSPNTKLNPTLIQTGKNLSLSRFKENQSLQKPLRKHQNNHDQIVKDNLHLHENIIKYQHLKPSPKSKQSQVKSIHPVKSVNYQPQILIKDHNQSIIQNNKIQKSNIQHQYVNRQSTIAPQVRNSQRNEYSQNTHPITPTRKISENIKKSTQQINYLSSVKKIDNEHRKHQKDQIDNSQHPNSKCPVDYVKQNHMENILAKQCNIRKSNQNLNLHQKYKSGNKQTVIEPKLLNKNILSPKSHQKCTCGANKSNCKCCLDHLKNQLRIKAQKDIDLNNRLITSARKTTLYKNYSLNNVENAELNPHNYRNCCGQLNVS